MFTDLDRFRAIDEDTCMTHLDTSEMFQFRKRKIEISIIFFSFFRLEVNKKRFDRTSNQTTDNRIDRQYNFIRHYGKPIFSRV